MKVSAALDNALVAHQKWKSKLRQAIASGDLLDVKAIERDDCCELGKWIYGNGRIVYGHFPEFERLLNSHRNFHFITSIVANIINSRNIEQSHSMIAGNSQFAHASSEVALAIFALKACVLSATEINFCNYVKRILSAFKEPVKTVADW